MPFQISLEKTVTIEGVNVFNGKKNYAVCNPAEDDTGIIFIVDRKEIPATLSNAYNHRYCFSSCIGLEHQGKQAIKVEHALSAFYALGIDNIRVALSDEVFPRLDFGVTEIIHLLQPLRREGSTLKKQLTIKGDLESSLRTCAAPGKPDQVSVNKTEGTRVTYHAYYPHHAIRHQTWSIDLQEYETIMHARAPFFLPLGSRLFIDKGKRFHGVTDENSLLIGRRKDAQYLNKKGLYDSMEFVKHKLIDAIGALALLGASIHDTEFTFSCTGHQFDLFALRELTHRGVFTLYHPEGNAYLRMPGRPNLYKPTIKDIPMGL